MFAMLRKHDACHDEPESCVEWVGGKKGLSERVKFR